MTWECLNCSRHYPDSSIGVPHSADADTKVACLECLDSQSPDLGLNGVVLVVGLVDHTQRDNGGRPITYWDKQAISIHELARMDNQDFWEWATDRMGAGVIAKYREDAEDTQL